MASDPDPSPVTLTGDPIVEEARRRFNRCSEWESQARSRFIDDLKFANGDSDNGYQWPNSVRQGRDVAKKPTLTINIIRQHNLMIVNEAKRNKSEPKVVPLGNAATEESAEVIEALIRHVGHQSNAQAARTTAREFQVAGGIGWWRIITDWASKDSFEQEIYIRRIWDPLSVYVDPDCRERDKSDMRFAFVFDVLPKKEFKEAFPDLEEFGTSPLGIGTYDDSRLAPDHIRVVEYFRKVPKRDWLASYLVEGERVNARRSRMPPAVWDAIREDPLTRVREIWEDQVEWYLIVGEKIVDRTDWPGKYIPLICAIGEEVVIDGRLDRKGHTRAMKDAQRMFNYNASAQVEFGALQTKAPWIAPVKAIEDLETYWNTANYENHSVLPWNHVDDQNPDQPIPPPQRPEPPSPSPAFQVGMDTAFNQLMMSSGQWQNQMGMMGNERTGRAIAERQEQSDTSVYHFQDNYEMALRCEAMMLIDLFPKIYDTKRVLKVLADDGVSYDLIIDPSLQVPFQQEHNWQQQVVRRIFNPALGEYEIAPSFGPAYASRRKETADALTLILTQAPALTGVIGDLLMESLDFDKAAEAARRMRRMVPPQALGQGPSQQEQILSAQVAQLQELLAKALQKDAKNQLKLVGKDEMRDIDVYKAETERIKALADQLGVEEEGLDELIKQLIKDSLATHLGHIPAANRGTITSLQGDQASIEGQQNEAPMQGARQAPDGEWYLQDPTREGKYLRVTPLAQERRPRGVIANG